MKAKQIKQIKGKILVQTGLHIGSSAETMEIGGVDNPILRNSANNEPYIPGSSLKGKMRSLMEWHLGKLHPQGEVYMDTSPDCPITRVFGRSAEKENRVGPTRLIVRDCFLSEESRQLFKGDHDITEVKHENFINRITAMANPRPLERVVPGVTFDLDIAYRVIDTGDDGHADLQNFHDVVLKALALLEQDCLGGCGSRGCGKVKFSDLKDETGADLQLPAV
ncbi:MAG TPA: type III-A CRISPR-associated RAMP protein Csm3 [Anaerohalosphaeraceae bacterium]|jgi:CRISPR-associated protein Csm3|nr:type III-A CRISPR-associated RAMP protein Csm3 [Anaerohalosphaeraceae bacterium]HOT74098.1 type III-A CRISPR-associated RAMP protein Csm3 [Anaerohalosphaeraceae bacterium]HPB94194.1 type III-A CRISPR-associated RAMP protein Csm3 [Anaerohalosphaeraceae bacterium]HQG07109.1 type III-A CRISPR-associated RAMP protein Csm3 [Anaerohalosphaeraceae bacterium]HQI08654.1 type III-A CRISPR-associated RAMP protein Csm3 [Anaerohalosphaeraceae bacterium]